jgi:uncharacterized protein
MPEQRTARAAVATATPQRYATQLVSHPGHRAEVRDEAPGTRLVLGDGSCLVTAYDDVLELLAEADSLEGLEHVTRVVGSHLERFGRRQELAVVWS